MNKTIKEIIHKNSTILLRITILLALGWLSYGFFPILNLESDSALFSAGCERLWANGINLPPDYFYAWNMQPLTGFLVVLIKHITPHFSCELIYSLLTIICSVSFLFIGSVFVSKLIEVRWEYVFFIFLFLPESYSIGYYSNTAIFASSVSLLGFLLILKKPVNPLSVVLLGIAPLLRVDILAIYPVILFLFRIRFDFKKSIFFCIVYLFSTLFISACGFWLLKANPLSTLNHYENLIANNSTSIDIASFIKINATFYPVFIIILVLLGLFILVKSRNFLLLSITLLPILTLYIIYRDFNGAAPKHIQYLLPFMAILVVTGSQGLKKQIVQRRYNLSIICCILFLIQSFIGIRVYLDSKPWLSKKYSIQYSQPTIARLSEWTFKGFGSVRIVIGTGQIISTADELMLLSGNFFAPFYWNKIKISEMNERKVLEDIISKTSDSLYFLTTQASDWIISQKLHSLGFKIEGEEPEGLKDAISSNNLFVRGDKFIYVTCVTLERTVESIDNGFQVTEKRPLYVFTNWDWQLYFINEKMTKAEPISKQIAIVK